MEIDIGAIRIEMARKNWNMNDLAKHAGIPYTTLASVMSKRGTGLISTAGKIAKGLGVEITAILTEGGNKENETPRKIENGVFKDKIEQKLKSTKKLLLRYIREAYDLTSEDKGYVNIYNCLDMTCIFANTASVYEGLLLELEGENETSIQPREKDV